MSTQRTGGPRAQGGAPEGGSGEGTEIHKTLSPQFIGHIDQVSREDGGITVRGWIVCLDASLAQPSYRAGETKFETGLPRDDVAKWYKTENRAHALAGFQVLAPAAGPRLEIRACVGDQAFLLFDLELPAKVRLSAQRPPHLLVVDDFYEDPDAVRSLALSQEFGEDLRYFKGQRTFTQFKFPGLHERFERLLNAKVTRWDEMAVNGIFQFCTAVDPLVYHSDTQMYAGAVYLTPNAPPQCGTSFYRSRAHPEVRRWPAEGHAYKSVFPTGHYDRTKFELVDTIGNVYNRLVIWDAHLLHSATEYFGDGRENGRLFHLFFFDIEYDRSDRKETGSPSS